MRANPIKTSTNELPVDTKDQVAHSHLSKQIPHVDSTDTIQLEQKICGKPFDDPPPLYVASIQAPVNPPIIQQPKLPSENGIRGNSFSRIVIHNHLFSQSTFVE